MTSKRTFLFLLFFLVVMFFTEKEIPLPEKIFQGNFSIGIETSFADLPKEERIKMYYKAGVEFGKSLDYLSAIAEFEKVLILDPEHEKALLWLGWLYRRLGREHEDKKGISFQKAIDYYKKAIEVRKQTSSYNELSSLYLELKMYQEAFEAADKAIEIDPDNARAWHYRGLANRFLGNFSEAKKDFEKSLELDPDNATVEENLSIVKDILSIK
jgi:tetratricopeptide (TPR) repeat protein